MKPFSLISKCSCCTPEDEDLLEIQGAKRLNPELQLQLKDLQGKELERWTSGGVTKIEEARQGEQSLVAQKCTSRVSYESIASIAETDFAGSWLCSDVRGDMAKYLGDMGLSTALVAAAEEAGYGVGSQVQNIAQSGNLFVIQNVFGTRVTMRFQVGAGIQKCVDQEGSEILIDPTWDGQTLCVVSKRCNGDLIANSRRYLEAGTMVLQLKSPNGAVVDRLFVRKYLL